MRTISGFLGVLILPDANTIRIMKSCVLTHRKLRKRLAKSAYVVKPEGAHVTLYQSRHFKRLPVSVAQHMLDVLRTTLVESETFFTLTRVEPYRHNSQYLFWQAGRTPALDFAHAMSVSFAAWTDRSSLKGPDRRYGYGLVGEDFEPHITLAADPTAFKDLKSFEDEETRMLVGVQNVVFARMGEWGKIEEILF